MFIANLLAKGSLHCLSLLSSISFYLIRFNIFNHSLRTSFMLALEHLYCLLLRSIIEPKKEEYNKR